MFPLALPMLPGVASNRQNDSGWAQLIVRMAAGVAHAGKDTSTRPTITGLSPKEGVPGTQIKIRGEYLGTGQSDLVALSICGTDCLMSARWKSPSLIIARVGQAKRGVGDIVVVTKSGGRSSSNVKFRVFIVQIGALEESAVWVDESRSVPGREAVRNIPENTNNLDVLGLKTDLPRKMDTNTLMQMYPEKSGNLRMENFSPEWYLLENHRDTSLTDLRKGLAYLDRSEKENGENTMNTHRANLYSLISCVDSLAAFHDRLQIERNTLGWPLTKNISDKLEESYETANNVFHEVLSRKDRADATRNALSVLTRFRFIFFLSSNIDKNIAKGEYSTILNDYTRAKSLFKDTEVALFKEVMAELDAKMEVFKQNMKQRLIDMPTSFEDQSKLIKYLKILEPESDPAWDCITAYHCWLEDLLWQLQQKHHKIAVKGSENKNGAMESGGFPLVDTHPNTRHDFVQAIVELISDKLKTFWKLSQVYSASATNINSIDRQHDINQMLINTINVSSWLMLNALVPSSLPDVVIEQYKEQFVRWPDVNAGSLTNQLFLSLKTLRNCISSMLDFTFTSDHLQPLIELCMTIRLKCLSKVIEKTSQGIIAAGSKETWRIERVENNHSKTVLPDLYETELNGCLSPIRQILSYSGFPGELDLFTRERFRSMLIDLFIVVLTSIRECLETLLLLRNDMRRPSALSGETHVSSKKLLISICNIDYIVNFSLSTVCRKLAENEVKYGDVIFEKSKAKLLSFRQNLIKCYLQLKCTNFSTIIDGADYINLPSEDAHDYIKELIMCVVFIQAEICLLTPQFFREILCPAVQTAFQKLMEFVTVLDDLSLSQTTQIVIDVSAFEESLQNYLSLESRTLLNAFRAGLLDKIDQTLFQNALRNFRSSMRLAIASLNCDMGEKLDETSDI